VKIPVEDAATSVATEEFDDMPQASEEEVDESGADQSSGEESSDDRTAELEQKLMYLAADFENYKRQTDRRIKEAGERATRRVLEQLLPVLDNFNLALQYAGTAKDVASLKMGLDFVGQQMDTALRGAGLEQIGSIGQKFDPAQHEALEEVEREGTKAGTVVEETQRGYSYAGQVLRPSRVRVAK